MRISPFLACLALLASPATAQRAQQRVFFGPNAEFLNHDAYVELFDTDSAWPWVQRNIDLFQFHVNSLRPDQAGNRSYLEDDELVSGAKFIKRRSLEVAVEVGGLRPFFKGAKDPSTWGAAGEFQAAAELAGLQRWSSFGGRVDVLLMDAPFSKMWDALHMPWAVAASELADYMIRVRSEFPGVEFGLIEPVPNYTVGNFPVCCAADHGDLIDLFDEVLPIIEGRGEKISFFMADSPSNFNEATPGGWQKLVRVQQAVRDRGLSFGWYVNDTDGGNSSDSLFYANSLAGWTKFRSLGGDPTEVGIRSWTQYPEAFVPDDTAGTFSFLARQVLHDLENDELALTRWPGSHPRVPFYVSESLLTDLPTIGPPQHVERAARLAATAWNDEGASELRFSLEGFTPVDQALDDGINAIVLSPDECPHGSTCMGDFVVYGGGDYRYGFDIVLHDHAPNGDPIVWATAGPAIPGTVDLRGVLTRQLGLAAGLLHQLDGDGVMATTCSQQCAEKRSLGPQTVLDLQALVGVYTNDGIWTDVATVAAGDTIGILMDYPLSAGRTYQVLVSTIGAAGFPMGALGSGDSRRFPIDLPLVPIYEAPMFFTDFAGVVDSEGQATASLQLPQVDLTGLNLYFTVLTLDSLAPSGILDLGVSVQVPIE